MASRWADVERGNWRDPDEVANIRLTARFFHNGTLSPPAARSMWELLLPAGFDLGVIAFLKVRCGSYCVPSWFDVAFPARSRLDFWV